MNRNEEYFKMLALKLNKIIEAREDKCELNKHRIHSLKIIPKYFKEVNENRKTF